MRIFNFSEKPRVTKPSRPMSTALVIAALTMTMAFGLAACGNKESLQATATSEKKVTPAPVLEDPSATGRELITKWLTALKDRDLESIEEQLAPNFQIRRANGSTANKEEYLKSPAVVTSFELSEKLVGLQHGQTLSLNWAIKVEETIGGITYSNSEAPRMTSFEWNTDKWQIVTYANFNAPATVTTTTTSTTTPTTTTTAG